MSPPISRKFNFGTLAPPTASAPGGVYGEPEVVALSSAPGTTIRYTLDGSEPTAVSNLYVTPIPVTEGTVVVKARAFHPDWTMSPVVTETYTIDTVAPTITARVFPSPLNGWHSSPVTVTFTCTDAVGVASCSLPATVATEGAGQVLTGTAVDLAGRQATLDVTLNLDFVAPEVTLIGPADGLVTSDTAVLLTGQVSDALSGISTATCNGVAATVVDGHVSCAVPLRPGRNAVVLHARDLAGHAASVGVTVARVGTATRLTLAPATRTLLVDEAAELSLLDDFGVPVPEAAWTSSDPGIVSLSPDDPPVLTAVSAGAATITATKNGLTSEATITVVAGTVLVDGTTRWALAPTPGLTLGAPIYTNRVDETVPDLFTVETDAAGTTLVRAVTASGEAQWSAEAPGVPLMGDSFGGLVAGLGPDGEIFSGLARFAGPAGALPWRFEPEGGDVFRPAQGPDGTLYMVEARFGEGANTDGTPIVDRHVLVLDGATGLLRARIPLAREVWNFESARHGEVYGYDSNDQPQFCESARKETPPEVVGPIVGADGHGYLLVRHRMQLTRGNCLPDYQSPDARDVEVGLTLLRLAPTGAVTTEVVQALQCSADHYDRTVCDLAPRPEQLVPDGLGGVLVTATYTTGVVGNDYVRESRATRFDVDAGRVDYPIPGDLSILLTGDANTAFVGTGGAVHAMETTTGVLKWATSGGLPLMALDGGSVAVQDSMTGTVQTLDASGVTTGTSPLAIGVPAQLRFGIWVGTATSTPSGATSVAAQVTAPLNAVSVSYGTTQGTAGASAGNALGQSAPAVRRFSNREEAALKALEFIYPLSALSNKEYGGLVCRSASALVWSQMVFGTQSAVEVRDSLCPPGTGAAHFHTHPPLEREIPSSPDDYDQADAHPGIPYYLKAPMPHDVTWPPTRTRFLKYWRSLLPAKPAQNNLCRRDGLTWHPEVAGAICSTPTP